MNTLFKSIAKPGKSKASEIKLSIGLYTPVHEEINKYVHLESVSVEEAQKLWIDLEKWLKESNAMEKIPNSIELALNLK